jgi:hypothetical protein
MKASSNEFTAKSSMKVDSTNASQKERERERETERAKESCLTSQNVFAVSDVY